MPWDRRGGAGDVRGPGSGGRSAGEGEELVVGKSDVEHREDGLLRRGRCGVSVEVGRAAVEEVDVSSLEGVAEAPHGARGQLDGDPDGSVGEEREVHDHPFGVGDGALEPREHLVSLHARERIDECVAEHLEPRRGPWGPRGEGTRALIHIDVVVDAPDVAGERRVEDARAMARDTVPDVMPLPWRFGSASRTALTVLTLSMAGCSLLYDWSALESAGSMSAPEDASSDGASIVGEGGDGAAGDVEAGLVSYADAVLADRPILYARLGERAGSTIATDLAAPSRPPGTYGPNVVCGVPGAIRGDPDTACRFPESGLALKFVRTMGFGGKAPYTVEAWVRPLRTNAGHAVYSIAGRDTISAGYLLALFANSGPQFLRESADGGFESAASSAPLSSVDFTYVVGTFDGATLALYVNGAPTATSSVTREVPATSDTPFGIGADDTAADNQNFIGDIDEVAVYDFALTKGQIDAHLRAGLGPP
jgi:hypothetical protein